MEELADFAEEHEDSLRIFQMPSYARELNPAEGIWSLLKRHLADFTAADLALPDRRLPPGDWPDHGRQRAQITGHHLRYANSATDWLALSTSPSKSEAFATN
ncbi:hypothetical protein AV521_35945 [Streptomyces sp. IMTB 2501]|uniref:transposase n=1 Tax=Streptomyces sp. IMTB 2501 TaxID=1776340 RepID=UPI00096E9BC6|nr:transposase [Streptomyces sp. IMTB 2501]OLZ64198.1 hypothetical protein AV521_35945 [Streptomyces sp. IMTB 2501]